MQNAALLSYCAPLKDLYQYPFQWNQIITNQPSSPQSLVSLNITTTTNHPAAFVPPPPPLKSQSHDTTRLLPIHAITILRHPVARVWSMYRFQTKACYQCRSLLEIYQQIDDEEEFSNNNNNITSNTSPLPPPIRNMCKSQLINHQTRNLLSTTTISTENTSDDELSFAFNYTAEQIQNAIYNMQHVFTMIGLTEDMNMTARMVGTVFPWLAEDLLQTLSDRSKLNYHNADIWDPVFGIMPSSDEDHGNEWVLQVHVPTTSSDGTTGTSMSTIKTTISNKQSNSALRKCPIRHENASPTNNHCANNGRDHLPLPSVPPDDATIAAILAHNVADVALYEAAVQQFALQQQVLFGNRPPK